MPVARTIADIWCRFQGLPASRGRAARGGSSWRQDGLRGRMHRGVFPFPRDRGFDVPVADPGSLATSPVPAGRRRRPTGWTPGSRPPLRHAGAAQASCGPAHHRAGHDRQRSAAGPENAGGADGPRRRLRFGGAEASRTSSNLSPDRPGRPGGRIRCVRTPAPGRGCGGIAGNRLRTRKNRKKDQIPA